MQDLSRQISQEAIEIGDSEDTEWELVVKEIQNFPDVIFELACRLALLL